MKKEHQETLLQTIKSNLERNEKGEVHFIPCENGKWNLAQAAESLNGLANYFKPHSNTSFDKYGNPKSDKSNQ